MAYNYKGKKYSSKKHPMLEYIFSLYNPNNDTTQNEINFTLKDISNAYRFCDIPEPASISNTILDLTRKNNDISSRLPKSIYSLGYDLKKKTGPSPSGDNYAGTFVFVGVGNQIEAWFKWPETCKTVEISSKKIPKGVRQFIRNDEGALFSVIDYCDVFSQTFFSNKHEIYRVQNPMKWQPNEIDGCYYGNIDNKKTIFSVEAKALTTRDDINLFQLEGGVRTILDKLKNDNIYLIPIAIQMVENGIKIAQFKEAAPEDHHIYQIQLEECFLVKFTPKIESWSN